MSGDVRAARCGFVLQKTNGIVRALAPERRAYYEQFLDDYSTIRNAEGRGSTDREYYRALPYRDLSGKNTEQWRIRACTYRYFESKLLERTGLDILDLGAGNGWMSYRLTQRGDRPVAVDIFTDSLEGWPPRRSSAHFRLVEAEFDHLPFADRQFDLAVFNSSFHYSTDYRGTLREARRCLKPSGPDRDSRYAAVQAAGTRRADARPSGMRIFKSKYGFPSDSVPSLEFLLRIAVERACRASCGCDGRFTGPGMDGSGTCGPGRRDCWASGRRRDSASS